MVNLALAEGRGPYAEARELLQRAVASIAEPGSHYTWRSSPTRAAIRRGDEHYRAFETAA